MTTPTISPTSISGADTSTSVTMASRATSRTSGPVIQLSLSRDLCPLCRERGRILDRHPHDLFVGGDHLVAHRYHRLDGDFRFGHGGRNVHDVGLAAPPPMGLGIALLPQIDHRADRILDQRTEARPCRIPAAAPDLGDAGGGV